MNPILKEAFIFLCGISVGVYAFFPFAWCRRSASAIREDLLEIKTLILMTKTELEAGLKALTAQSGKIAAEQAQRFDDLSAKIKALEDAINAGEVPAEVTAAFEELKTAQQALDDTIPDAPPTT